MLILDDNLAEMQKNIFFLKWKRKSIILETPFFRNVCRVGYFIIINKMSPAYREQIPLLLYNLINVLTEFWE